MSTGWPRRLIRATARPLLCAMLALAALVSPWESGLLPGPLEDLGAQPHAEAQTPPPRTVIEGTPDNCRTSPILWSPQPGDPDFETAPECVLELPACPESPLVTGQYMRLSVPPAGLAAQFSDLAALYTDAIEYPAIAGMDRYPEFCEERVLQVDDPVAYDTCINITGYTVIRYTDAGNAGCRLIYPITCPAGMHRSGSATCRAVHRRNWTCRTGYIPRNEFNTCYRTPTHSGVTHPACRQGAPEFPVMGCEEYVDADFIHAIDCLHYSTGTPAEQADGTQAVSGAPTVVLERNSNSGPSRDFWCAFETRFLIADCHRTDISPAPAECSTTSKALCLKRASATGGCNLTAATIRCRALEAAFAQQPTVTTIEEVRQQGCAPCLILPFRSIPPQCQLSPPRTTVHKDYTKQERILSVMADFALDVSECRDVMTPEDLRNDAPCRGYEVCADPPRGRIDWTSNHFSQLAVVNSPVLVQFLDIPLENRAVDSLRHEGRFGADPIWRFVDRAPHFVDSSGGDPRLRTFNTIDPSVRLNGVKQMITTECRIGEDPYFDIIIEELWPDSAGDRMIIRQLFGDDALAWWNSLSSTEREQRTLSRGLSLLSSPPTAAELEARSSRLTTQVHCDLAGGRACRWLPTRPGFYRLKGVGAWLQSRAGSRTWGTHDSGFLDTLIDHLVNVATPEDSSCQPDLKSWSNTPTNTQRMRDKDCIRMDLLRAGFAAPSDVGMLDDLSGVVNNPSDDEALFTEDFAATAACRPRDFRVTCGGGYGTGNYTETEPVGVMVHEVRVSTVAPSH